MTKAIILAAGVGSRLRPLTNNTPKSLVPICGTSLIERQIKLLLSRGIDDIIIIGGYRSDLIENLGFPVVINNEFENTNMVYSLSLASDFLTEDTVITYGDIIYSPSILDKLLSSTHQISLTIDMNWRDYWCSRSASPLSDLETLSLDSNGLILDIGKKPNSFDQIDGQYMGISYFKENILQSILPILSNSSLDSFSPVKSLRSSYMTDFFQHLINLSFPIASIPIYFPWIEIDTLEDFYSSVTRDRLRSIDKELGL